MIALCLLACLALAGAAPQFPFNSRQEHGPFMRRPPPPPPPHHHHHHHDREDISPYFSSDIFDTRRFWSEMAQEMQRFDQMLTEFYEHFPTTSSRTGVQGEEYVVVINLNGFEEKDIKVKAREGVLMVQAVHKSDDGSERSYIDLKTLPSYVNVNGTWTYDTGVLRITFPLNGRPDAVTETAVVDVETKAPDTEDRDREDVEENQDQDENHNADVGLERGDKDDDIEILTNMIPSERPVEATTYAVDLANEVEFVPVRY